MSTLQPLPARPPMTTANLVEKYVLLRDRMKLLRKQHTDQLAPYADAMSQIELLLMAALNQAGVEQMRAPAGTFFKTKTSTVKVTNFDALLDYVRENNAWELLPPAVSKPAVDAHFEDTQTLPPGVEITRTVEVNVRRS